MIQMRRLILIATLALTTAGSAKACDEVQTQVATTPVVEQSPARLSRAIQRIRNTNKEHDILLLGDSLADGWISFQQRDFKGKSVLNFGIGGDKTQETLWRLTKLLPPTPPPKNVLLIIGTNNLTDISALPCGIAAGISANVEALLSKWQSSRIFVVPILPRGQGFAFRSSDRLQILNLLTDEFQDNQQVSIVSIDEGALTCGGAPACQNFKADKAHLSGDGYVELRQFIEQSSIAKFGEGL